jgi:hypothetical protein
MAHKQFNDLAESLLKGGVAPRHVRRYLAELREHLADLTAEQRASGYDETDADIRARALLGSDRELAAAMLEQKQFRSWTARAPWAAFTLLPPFTAIAIGMLFIGPLVLIGKHYGFLGRHDATLPPLWFQSLAAGLVLAANLTMTPLAALLFVTIAARQRLRLVWPLAATLVMLVLVIHSNVKFADHDHSRLMLGAELIFFRQGWMMLAEDWPLTAVQYALTLLPVLWLCRPRSLAA